MQGRVVGRKASEIWRKRVSRETMWKTIFATLDERKKDNDGNTLGAVLERLETMKFFCLTDISL